MLGKGVPPTIYKLTTGKVKGSDFDYQPINQLSLSWALRIADEVEAVYPPTRTCGLRGEGRPLCPVKHRDPHKTTEKPTSDCALGARWCDGSSEARGGVGRTGAPARGRGPCSGDPRMAAHALSAFVRKKSLTCHCEPPAPPAAAAPCTVLTAP